MIFTGIACRTPDSLYTISCDSIVVDHTSGRAQAKALKITPRVDKYKIGHVKGHETDWISATINRIDVNGLLTNKIFKDSIVARSLNINNVSMVVFRDKRLEFCNVPDKLMPNELPGKLNTVLKIDALQLTGADITYQEHVAGAKKAGEISFNDLKVKAGPLSNAPGSVLSLNASTRVMNRGVLNANFRIPVTPQSNHYEINGSLRNMELTGFNPMMNYVAGVNIKSGVSHRLDFDFSHDLERSTGELRFLYENLNVQFIDSGKQGLPGGLDDAIATFIANTFVIKASNTPGEKMRVGKIEFERNKKKSCFNYWWKSILSGIKSSTGITEKS